MRRRAASRPSPGAPATRLTLAPFLVALAGLLAACTSPAAVTRYSTSAARVTAKMPDASAALLSSCRRTQSYRLRRTNAVWYGDDSVSRACAGRDSALRAVARANGVLAAYLVALGRLAGAKPGEMDASVAALGEASMHAGAFDRAEGDAITALAKFAASRVAGGYRRARLRAAIAEQNTNVQVVTTALHGVLDRDFARYLRDDETAQTAFYRSALTEHADGEPLAAILIRDSFDERQAALTARADAVDALARAMLVVARGHQRLYDSRDHLTARELLASILATARELDAAIAKAEKAF